MNRELIQNAEKFNKRNRLKKAWQKVVSFLGCIVVFCTTYALILPAITQEQETFCGYEAHVHSDSCYTQITQPQRNELICSLESLGLHVHSEACYDSSGRVICGEADYVIHTHSDGCFGSDGSVVCTIPEAVQHVHDDSCYAVIGGHSHGDACYETQRGALICERTETEAHTHTGACYAPGDTLLCTLPENHQHTESCVGENMTCLLPENHVHGADCYQPVPVCGLEETDGYVHSDACYEALSVLICQREEIPGETTLICRQPEAVEHIHSDSCFTMLTPDTLTCTLAEDENHVHGDRCFGIWQQTCGLESHEHTLSCYSDPNGDVETADVWEQTVASVKLSGIWSEDIVTIAETQLGYRESIANYIVSEDGETVKGYTRYGAWYGAPYDNWNAMFAAFCIHYAAADGVPVDSDCAAWVAALSGVKADLYRSADSYRGCVGDLVFFDDENDGVSDRVGIVYAVSADEGTLKVIEGDAGNAVSVVLYDLADPTIMGYGEIPENPDLKYECGLTAHTHDGLCGADCALSEHTHTKECLESYTYFCGMTAHTHEESCYDAETNLICTLAEHTHEALCMEAVRYPCNLAAHVHEGSCYDEEGNPVCGRIVHSHSIACEANLSALEEAEWRQVEAVVLQIDALPSADDIDAKIMEFEDAEDYEGEEQWLTQVYQDVGRVYYRYSLLTETAREYVVNRDKLLEMEYIWSAVPLVITEIAENVGYRSGLFNQDARFVIYTRSGDRYYAIDGNGNAVQIQIDADGTITADVTDKNTLLWTFTSPDSGAYLIRNVSSGRYLHSFHNGDYNNGVLTSGAYRSTPEESGSGVRIKGSNRYPYLNTSTGRFELTSDQSQAAVFQFGAVYGSHTVWLDGTNNQLRSLRGSPDTSYSVTHGSTFTLPETWQSPSNYAYTLRGWYDVKNQVYYAPGTEITVNENLVFYADWVASTYDIGRFNSQVADTISTNQFITTHVYDYTTLINTHSMEADVTVSASGHSEKWKLKDDSLKFVFIDYDQQGTDITWPNPAGNGNSSAGVYAGLFNEQLRQLLFETSNSHNPQAGTGVIGKNYLGTGDHLFQYGTDPNEPEHYGYYYYDSMYNAASYNQSAGRFYVYEYLERTSDSGGSSDGGKYSDFLPFNSPYANQNGKQAGTYTYAGESGEYNGVTHYQYDALYRNDTNIVTNYWFGIGSEIDFYLPAKPGTVDSDGVKANQSVHGTDTIFQFSGDDDVWVLVDGQVVLDIGGIHGVESGEINFSTGVVTVNGTQTNTVTYLEPGRHVMSFYYLERGSSMSNCKIRFNVSPRYRLSLQKEDVLNRHKLNGAQFSVFTDEACTKPAELWTSKDAYINNEPASNVFTVEYGSVTMWGFAAGNTYYIKETRSPDGYDAANGIIVMTLNNQGQSTYKVIEDPNATGDKLSGGFTVHGVKVDEETHQAYLIITNGKNVTETTSVQVQKKWNDTADHSNTPVTVYLWADGVKIREETLSAANNWTYVWTNLPKYHEDGETEVQYTVKEGVVPGYVGKVTELTTSTSTASGWTKVDNFTAGGTFLLKSHYGYLAAANNSLYWDTSATAQSSPNARWKVTTAIYQYNEFFKLTNEAGQTLFHKDNRIYAGTNPTEDIHFAYDASYQGLVAKWSPYLGVISNGSAEGTWNSNAVTIELLQEGETSISKPLEGLGFLITNSPTTEVMSLKVNKAWDLGNLETDVDYQTFVIPITLLKNGVDTGVTVELSLKNNWTATFQGLPKYDVDNSPISYSVREDWSKHPWRAEYGPIVSIGGSNTAYETTVTNVYEVTYMLPETGGIGTAPYTIGGMLMVAAALGGLLGQRYRRVRKEERGPP